jgi:hypothetical protein
MQASGTALVAVVCLSLGCGMTSGGTSGSDQRGEAGSGAARGATDSSGGFAAAADDGDSGVVEVDGGGALGVGATGNAADDEQSRELGEDSVAVYEFPPHRLADFARCGDAQVQRGLEEACLAVTSAPTILGSGAELPPSVVAVLELVGSDEARGARARFTPESTGAYEIYLGTPNIPFAASAQNEQVFPSCARYLEPSLSERLSGRECGDLRGLYRLELRGGVTYTLSLGPLSPERWVRVFVQAAPRDE